MGEDRRNGDMYRKKMKMKHISWICIYLLCMLGGDQSTASQDDKYKHKTEALTLTVTEEAFLVSSSERTSNTIPEAEEGLKKYGPKKSTLGLINEQLEKPYPYFKSQTQVQNHKKTSAAGLDTDHVDNNSHYSKRSGSPNVVAFNGTLSVSVSEPLSQLESNTESLSELELETKTETESDSGTDTTTPLSTTTVYQPTEPFTLDEFYSDWSTTPDTITTLVSETTHASFQDTQYITDSSSYPDSNTVSNELSNGKIGDVTTSLTVLKESTTPVTVIPKTTLMLEQQEENNTESSDALSTSTELIRTPLEEESITVTTDEEQQSTISLEISVQPTTMTTPTTSSVTTATITTTMTPASTEWKQITVIPAITPKLNLITTPITTMSSSNILLSSTATSSNTQQSSNTRSSNGKTLLKTTTNSEMHNSVFTRQNEGSESTTDFISPTLPIEDVTLLIRIVFEGTWHDVCSKLPILRQSLADLVKNSVEKPISPGQIVFHQTQCSEKLPPTSLMSEVPLTSVLVYVVDENGSFDGAVTKILPSLYEMTPIEFPLTIHSFVLVQEADSGNAIAVVIVSCVAFICLILLAGLLFIMRKRQGRFNYGERCRPVSLDAYSLDSVSAYNSVRRSKGTLRCSKRSYGNPTFEDSSAVPSHPLNFAALSAFCEDTAAISDEFVSIPQVSAKMDELPAGAELKNRYANVIPLPETRVLLQRLGNDPLTEYINASYVRGPKNASKYYIACQAPTDNTVADFWRMIWEQQCKVIIMLTDLVENGAEKCTEYIPPLEVSDCHRLYGDFQVTLKKREAKEKYAISTLHLKNLENNTFREVSHIWYLWPTNGAPTDAVGLIAVLLEARALQRGAAGPIVVHCSPGTGRTGTLIALDLGIRQYEITRTVDVPRVVYTIRRDRAGAVQTREQYVFIYKALNLYASKLAGGSIEST